MRGGGGVSRYSPGVSKVMTVCLMKSELAKVTISFTAQEIASKRLDHKAVRRAVLHTRDNGSNYVGNANE